MGLSKPVFTDRETEALVAAATFALRDERRAVEALGHDPVRIETALRALDKLKQQIRRRP